MQGGGGGGSWTSLQARANLRAIFAFHKFLTLSFLSAKVHWLELLQQLPAGPACIFYIT